MRWGVFYVALVMGVVLFAVVAVAEEKRIRTLAK